LGSGTTEFALVTEVNSFVFQCKMDEVKAEPAANSDISPMFLSSEHQLLEVNDEGLVTYDILRNGAKVSVSFYYTLNCMSDLFEKEMCAGPLTHLVLF
jgi:hypothetical protein